jgi:hypothetical protein
MAGIMHLPRNPRESLPCASNSSSSAVCAARERGGRERRYAVSGPEPPEGRVSLCVLGTFLPSLAAYNYFSWLKSPYERLFRGGKWADPPCGRRLPHALTAVPSPLDCSVGRTHLCGRARLPGAPSSRGLSRRCGCGPRRGGTLPRGGSASLYGLSPARCCPRGVGGRLPLVTAGA